MYKGVFDILGPIMIGPSSSHTAGAARIGRIAREIIGNKFAKAVCHLHGSFAKTYKGHGTDIAIVAGLMGIAESDENLKNAFAIAAECGKIISFEITELNNVHENTVKIVFDDNRHHIIGSSLGGGNVMITEYDGFKVSFTGNSSTLIITHLDKSGVIAEVSSALANRQINIGTMYVSRKSKGDLACMVIECDGEISEATVDTIMMLPDIISARYLKKIY